MIIVCNHCKKETDKPKGAVNRALKINAPLYCDKICAGLGRRDNKTIEEKKRLKAEYDKEFRKKNATEIKKRKHEYFKKTYDPQKASVERKKRMPKHIEYCRQPKYKEWKKEYDLKYRAKKEFGEFWESAILINKIEAEYNQREVRQINNLHNKSQKRKRKWKTMQNKSSLLRT